MKKIIALTFILVIALQFQSNGQTKKIVKPLPKLIHCHIPSDTANSSKVSLEQAHAWADSVPLKVIDEKGNIYILQNFVFSIITMNPFETREFGIGNNGIPLLARKAMNNLKQKDTIFLKEVTYLNNAKEEKPLANIVFSIR